MMDTSMPIKQTKVSHRLRIVDALVQVGYDLMPVLHDYMD